MADLTGGFPGCVRAAVLDEAVQIMRAWDLDCGLAGLVAGMMDQYRKETNLSIMVISGYRSRAEQAELKRRGNRTAPDDLSNHRVTPSRAVDVSLGAFPVPLQKAHLGRIAVFWGLRWGGGGDIDPETGLPLDWNHFDLGVRPAHLTSGP